MLGVVLKEPLPCAMFHMLGIVYKWLMPEVVDARACNVSTVGITGSK